MKKYVFISLTVLFISLSFFCCSEKDKENFWLIEDAKIYHQKFGKGDELVFLHGGPCVPLIKFPQEFNDFLKHYSVHFYHQRGCGNSELDNVLPTDNLQSSHKELIKYGNYRRHIDDIENIRKKLDKDKLVLIGEGFGGFLAAFYGIVYPEHLAGLIIINPTPISSKAHKKEIMKLQKNKMPENKWHEYINNKNKFNSKEIYKEDKSYICDLYENLVKLQIELRKSKDINVKKYYNFDKLGCLFAKEVLNSLGAGYNLYKTLTNISAPTMVIYGDGDAFPMLVAQDYANNIRGARLEVINGAGGYPHIEKPKNTADIMLSFLDHHIFKRSNDKEMSEEENIENETR